MDNQSSFRQIFKATSIFGGVQVITVLTSIIRSKFVAIFLGPSGMGISSLLVSAVNLIINISGMGLTSSAIRDISIAKDTGNNKQLSYIIIIFRKWLFIGCFIGIVILICLSSFLSQFSFGNKDYTVSFILLSIMLIFTTLTNGNNAILQGTRKIGLTAKSAILGAIASIFTSIPFYYFFGSDGIVPALIMGSFISFLISYFFASKIPLTAVNISRKEVFDIGGRMAKLGIVMVLAQLLGAIVIYLINAFIRNSGGISDVGLYQAGISLTNQSIGLVFTAMAVDYFPRLSAISESREKVNEMVNQQGVITLLIASPLLILLIVFAPFFIHILLSPTFYVISDFIRWIAFGTLFTVPMVVLGYIPLAKGDKRIYFMYGSFYNSILSLFFYVGGYILKGLLGIAIAFFIFQLLYLVFMSVRFYKLYSFSYNFSFLKVFISLGLLSLAALICTLAFSVLMGYIFGGLILLISAIYSFNKLDKFLDIRSFLLKRIIK